MFLCFLLLQRTSQFLYLLFNHFKKPFLDFYILISSGLFFKEKMQKMNILNLKQIGNMIYTDPRIEEEEDSRSMLPETYSEEDSTPFSSSSSLCSSSDLTDDDDDVDDDDTSSSSSSSNGPLEDLSDLMSHLPIKRGLSKFYEGKSQSFTSLASVKSLEDLMKRGFHNRGYGGRKKTCRSTGGILEQSYKRVYNPKISKKSSRTASVLSCLARKRH